MPYVVRVEREGVETELQGMMRRETRPDAEDLAAGLSECLYLLDDKGYEILQPFEVIVIDTKSKVLVARYANGVRVRTKAPVPDPPSAGRRRYGLYWNRRGELYNVELMEGIVVEQGKDSCRIQNLSTGSSSIQTCEAALDHHLSVDWFTPCTGGDLAAAFEHNTTVGSF